MRKNLYLLKNVFLKRIIIVITTIAILFLTNILFFTISRSLVSTHENINKLSELTASDIVVSNFDPTNDFSQITNIPDDKKKDLNTLLDNNFEYGVQYTGMPLENELFGININLLVNLYDENSYGFNNLKVGKGENFTPSDFNINNKNVLVGANIGEKYPVGSELEIINPLTGEKETVRVKGVLKKNEFIPNYYVIDSKNYMNFTVIYPLENGNPINLQNRYFDVALSNIMINGSDKQSIQSLEESIYDNLNLKINFFSQEENLDDFKNSYIKSAILLLVIAIILVVILVLLIYWNALTSIKIMLQDITINMLTGLNYLDFRTSLYLFQSICSFIVAILTYIYALSFRVATIEYQLPNFMTINTLGLLRMDWIGILTTIFLNILIMIIVVEIIMKKIKKIPISLGVLT